jgi:hypothetical protein
MDSETAVIRAEMSQTRASLDRKLTLLENRARELSPRRYVRENMPDYALDRAIGTTLTLIGMRMVWGAWRRHRRNNLRTRLAAAGYW